MHNNRLIDAKSILLIFIGSMVLFLFLNAKNLFTSLVGKEAFVLDSFYSGLSQKVTEFIAGIENVLFTPDIVTFLFWAIIGSACFVIVGLTSDFLGEVRSILTIGKESDRKFHRINRRYWSLFIAQILGLFSSLIALIFWLRFSIDTLFKQSSTGLFLALFGNETALENVFVIAASYLLVFISVCGFYTVIQFIQYIRSFKL